MQPSLDRKNFFILYKKAVMKTDRDLTTHEEAMTLEPAPAQLMEHPDNGNFYVLHQTSPKVSIIYGGSGLTVKKITFGRASKKFGKVMAMVGASIAMAGLTVAAGPAFTVGNTSYYYVPNVVPAGYFVQKTYAAFSEDADFLYVYP